MSHNQNENQNTGGTIKPTVNKTNLRGHRPQTTGYQQEEVSETNNSTNQSKQTPPTTTKPSLNISASVYIPKSIASTTSSGNVGPATQDKNIVPANQLNSNVQSNLLNANTQAFTPKINNAYNQNMNMNTQINPMGQNYNMGQSNFYCCAFINELKYFLFLIDISLFLNNLDQI
jgi:hypothetical protein